MVAPAPMALIAEKLESKTEAVRLIALAHAAAHGSAAVALAGTIARMFEDSSAGVQRQAMMAFLVVGSDAADAVPVLAEQVRKGTPTTLVSRALAGLAKVGPAARSELDAVLEAWRSTSHRADALETLLQIAPEEPAVRSIFLEALYAEDFILSVKARKRLEQARVDVADWVLSDAEARLPTADRVVREGVAGIGSALALGQPARVAELVRPLLGRSGERCVVHALSAVSKLPRPLAASFVEPVMAVAGSSDDAAEQAMQVLSELGPVAAAARPLLIAQLHAHSDSFPIGGPEGRSSRVFRSAALALAAVCPEATDAVPTLLAWLARFTSRAWLKREKPSWYTIGDVALAAVTLQPTNRAVAEQIVSLAERSRKWARWDESGVRDFERKLRQIVSVLGDHADLWLRLQAMGIARVEADDPCDVDEESLGRDELPDFPPEEQPPELPRVMPVPKAFLQELDHVLREGERFIGVTAASGPAAVAAAVDATIRQAHRERKPLSAGQIDALAGVWGMAVAQATGWAWAHVIQGENSWICLVSEDHAHACAPQTFMEKQADRRHDTAALLLFNMLRAGHRPASSAGKLSFIGS